MAPEDAPQDNLSFWYQMTNAMCSHADSSPNINIIKSPYAATRLVACLSTEELLGAGWAGASLKNGDIVTLQRKTAGGLGFQYVSLMLSFGGVPDVLQ